MKNIEQNSSSQYNSLRLQALRLGLDIIVKRGDITVKEATDIFESARKSLNTFPTNNKGKSKKNGRNDGTK